MEAWKQKYLNKIVQGDCLEIMREIPEDSVDMTFADPPYNLGKKYEHYEDNKETREYLAWCREWLHEMVRITRS
ncbi:site-specific DNA-methyltransferase, partial [Nanoarchaeota archaeon]